MKDKNIFTIGDKVHHKKWNSKGTIKRFRILDSYLLVSVDWNILNNVCDDSEASLKDIEHLEQSLFTTKDGVEIFEGDVNRSIYYVNEYYNLDSFKAHLFNISNALKNWSNKTKLFSTKEAAEKYIIMNKPCLSIKELLDLQCKYSTFGDSLIGYSKELVKQKLNQS